MTTQYRRQTFDSIEGIEMMLALMQAVHAILMTRHAGEQRCTARRAATDRRKCIVENQTSLRQIVQVRRLNDAITIRANFEASIIRCN